METRNDIIAGNGRVFSVYMVTVRIKILNKYIMLMIFFSTIVA